VEEFHAFMVTDDSVGVAWDAPAGYNITQFQVFYQLKDPAVISGATKPNEIKSVRKDR
jgi:hypothetical protein